MFHAGKQRFFLVQKVSWNISSLFLKWPTARQSSYQSLPAIQLDRQWFLLKGKLKQQLAVFESSSQGNKSVGSPTVNVSFTFDVKMICSNNQYCKKPLSKSNITTSKSCSYKDGDGRWFWYCIPVDSTFPDFYWVKRPWNRKIKSLLVSELIIFIAYSHSRG